MTGKRTIAFHTLGCKLNFTESSFIASSLPEDKFARVDEDEKADIYVINTCSVTADAEKKCRQAVRKFINRSPDAVIAVIGCYSQLKAREIAEIPGVDIVLGTHEKYDLEKHLYNIKGKVSREIAAGDVNSESLFFPSWSSDDRTRTFIKIQDGCDYRCAYCTIPLARGRSRNAPVKTIIGEIMALVNKPVPEIVLTGVNTGDFGKSTGETFLDLLREIDKIEALGRVRLSSIEPDLLSDDIIDFVAGSRKIMPHFHIPLQSGSNSTLQRMRRRYRRELFALRVERIIGQMPLAGIGADIITGFPGETDEEFNETFSFIASLPVSYLHVFPYSERPGTAAAGMPGKIQFQIKEKRKKMLMQLSREKNREFKLKNVGTSTEVLFESRTAGNLITGLTPNYIRAETKYSERLKGVIKRVRITGIAENGNLIAEPEEQK
ncbi:MAG TPA: tRNA (N(6)-L-threonylcarbamoyladenosine(37)-C(2))-methylthiotransferase MtaB [Bacteroidales bacterium]|nr:tRNA (N(6)-L-threonylcarbamoyladenosine(37)-C(2))-methylthiotransferase MtaB [Bacteroidales bacterium]